METKQLNGYKIEFYTKQGFMRNCKFNNEFNKLEYTGLISGISEELANKIVEQMPVEIAPSPYNDMQGDYDYCYKDYKCTSKCEWVGWGSDANGFKTAKESFQTLSNLEYCVITKIE